MNLANMNFETVDQTPLPFTFNSCKGYDDKGTSSVWHRGCASLHQAWIKVNVLFNLQFLLMVKHELMIFCGKGTRIPAYEKSQYDGRV